MWLNIFKKWNEYKTKMILVLGLWKLILSSSFNWHFKFNQTVRPFQKYFRRGAAAGQGPTTSRWFSSGTPDEGLCVVLTLRLECPLVGDPKVTSKQRRRNPLGHKRQQLLNRLRKWLGLGSGFCKNGIKPLSSQCLLSPLQTPWTEHKMLIKLRQFQLRLSSESPGSWSMNAAEASHEH